MRVVNGQSVWEGAIAVRERHSAESTDQTKSPHPYPRSLFKLDPYRLISAFLPPLEIHPLPPVLTRTAHTMRPATSS